jgi:hypothetical protein
MMLAVLASFGACLTACLLQLTLGLRRPIARRKLAYAAMTLVFAGYLFANLDVFITVGSERVGVVRLAPALAIGALSLLTSVASASDFRARELALEKTAAHLEQHAARLERVLDMAANVRDKLNTPLQTFEIGLALHAAGTHEERRRVADLQRAVAELTELGRLLQRPHPPGRAA